MAEASNPLWVFARRRRFTAGWISKRFVPVLIVAIILTGLALVEIFAYRVHEIQEFVSLGYFVPVAIGARYFSRRRAVAVAFASSMVYVLAFLPHIFLGTSGTGELVVEALGRVGLYMAAGVSLSSFRLGMAREKEKVLAAEREKSERLKLMLDVSNTVSSSLKIDQVLQDLAMRLVDAMGASFCRISLLDETGDHLRVAAAHPARKMEWFAGVGLTIPLSDLPDHEKAINTREAVIVGGRRAEMFTTRRQEELYKSAKSLLVYPLVVRGRSVGAVCIGEHRRWDRSPLSHEKSSLCQTIVNQGAVAVSHALSHQTLKDTFVGTIRSLAEAIDAKDPSTRGHSDWVSKYAMMIGRQAGLENSKLDLLKYAGYLHDVGKIGIPDGILGKPRQLSSEEWKLMKKHPITSARILEPVRISPNIKAAIRHHHERYDGKGYPYGLAGESIPFEARILAVADSYEAMTSDRPYRKALSDEQAVSELAGCSGTQFDPRVVEFFMRALGRTPHAPEEMGAAEELTAG